MFITMQIKGKNQYNITNLSLEHSIYLLQSKGMDRGKKKDKE